MQKTKLIRTLKKLTEEEIDAFGQFVRSPYFNTQAEMARLLNILTTEGYVNQEIINPQEVYARLYPRQPYTARKITDALYLLTNLLEEFIAAEGYRKNRFQQKLSLLNQAHEKDLEPLINGVERDLDAIQEQSAVRDSNYFLNSFLYHSERDYAFRLHGKISGNESLQAKSDQLDIFFLALKLKEACEMLNRNRILQSAYHPEMLDIIVPYVQSRPDLYANHAAIQVYLNMYLMLTEKEGELYFFQLTSLAKENEASFTFEELRSIYGYAQNFCIRQANQGNTAYLQHLFGIYKHILSNGLVFADNKNMQWEFKNIVSLGLRLKEYEWTLQLINIFKERLPAEVRQNSYTYNLANYYYETGDYKKATRLLNSVEFTDIYYNLDSKTMLLKIYYKQEEEESLYALISAFTIYLRRNKLISKEMAEVYDNLLKFTRKAFILKTKLPYERDRNYYNKITRLKQALEKPKNIANVNWLRSEVEALA